MKIKIFGINKNFLLGLKKFLYDKLGSVHIKSKSKVEAREIVEIKIESSLS